MSEQQPAKTLLEASTSGDLTKLIELIPYAKLIGIEHLFIGESLLFVMPKNPKNLGNPTLPAIHGGVLGGFMETAGVLHTLYNTRIDHAPKVVDFSIDYLSPARHQDTFARCQVVRHGRKIINVSCTTMQTTWEKPVAVARMNILI